MGYRAIGALAWRATTAALLAGLVATTAMISDAAAQAAGGGMGMLDLEAERDQFFTAADADGDFALSSDEQMRAFSTKNADLFECWDSDGDGICSYGEYMDSADKVFEALDLDGDGVLSDSELQ